MNFISVKLYQKLLTHALGEGLDPANIAHLPEIEVSGKESQMVPADVFFELHELADKHLKPGCAVRVGQKMELDDYGVLGLSWKTCSQAGEIYKRSERYFKLLTNTYVFRLENEGEVSHIHLLRDNHRRGIELSNEATFSASVVVLKAITETDIAPISVSFKHSSPSDLESYKAAFGCPILFEQDFYRLSYKTSDLDRPTAKADKRINQFIVTRMEEEAKGIEMGYNKLLHELEGLIKDALPSGIPGIHDMGRQLGMSSRTLTRRLSENGYTFRRLVNKTQEEISSHLLKHTHMSVGEIAFQTGFSEQSAFNRAFKRWTGQSPISYRNN